MLTSEEIDHLRNNVRRASFVTAEGGWFRYADGPLKGLRVRLDATETQYLHGWCQLTRSGPVTVFYTTDRERSLCIFEKFDTPGLKTRS